MFNSCILAFFVCLFATGDTEKNYQGTVSFLNSHRYICDHFCSSLILYLLASSRPYCTSSVLRHTKRMPKYLLLTIQQLHARSETSSLRRRWQQQCNTGECRSMTKQNLCVRSRSAQIPVGGASRARPTNLRVGSDPDLTEWEPPRPSVGLHTLPGTSHCTQTHFPFCVFVHQHLKNREKIKQFRGFFGVHFKCL